MIFDSVQAAADYFPELYYDEWGPCDVKVVVVSGGFDPLHVGHVRYLESAKTLGTHLVVIVNGDGFLVRKKGKPFMRAEERMAIVDALRCVDFVVPWDDGTQTVCGALRVLEPHVFANGGDRSQRASIPEAEVCDDIGCELAFGVGGEEKAQSSSTLVADWMKNHEV